ncbi:cisplatin damage response ATP-dependent DNA ligase [Brucella pseudogrignonensis]|uniref:cisplatin damage response ATP-dependent DNA ligase n=1 Tax=Brucella pseudogrignonensis TaxID=419475 RepID=UPI000CFABAFA|nr:cisplatin damage response ATP-dependent DNA ligase [Brucella pseudogrignonensis]MQP40924.1 cisplatin damage response ATP-dependent DNA ligase [Ochrobactrum sp. MYb237]PQZ40878.1 ATP-dependent DNA ligase [Brucella pseudogrignonensis]PRA40403.1 ATP-dependent DNA ligase [Brucella pseudogrignonensis]PRA68996.1 ATP-dependent DNA ligase [Brucella pseudogrignonensis]
MRAFAELLDRLVLTPQRNGKLRLLVDYFRTTPDPDRGLALAAITRDLELQSVKPAMLRALIAERSDPTLFAYSYDYVGDLAETISLIWPGPNETPAGANLPLSVVVHELQNASRREGPLLVAGWLDLLGISERYALLKLVTGGLRIGVSARLAKQALADFGGVDVVEIEELWHGQTQPFTALFAWLEGHGPKPAATADAPFRPVMLATALDEAEIPTLDPSAYSAEWKWDGIRVQAVAENGVRRLYSRTGDDISGTFPDVLEAMDFEGSIDGELLVGHHGETGIETATFSDLQQRLNRKTVTAKQLREYPAFIRAYDLLHDGTQQSGEDLRSLPFSERRARLAQFVEKLDRRRFDLSPVLQFSDFDELAKLRLNPPHPVIEGLMLKRHDSAYVPGRPKGPWFKWKRDPFTVDAVVVYAQRGHGKRSSFYSDFTFAVWTGPEEDPMLVPVGKAYFGFTDEELKLLDKFVRENTIERFGPVRSVRAEPDHGLVVEVAFEGLNRSTRHKSGVAMRFPRFSRLRWDKPPREADRLETLEKLLS